MKKIFRLAVVLILIFGFTGIGFARDVHVKGYYRKDGTYVRPHIRSSPNKYKWDNYGPSQSDDELLNPRSRDYDRDGTPNYLDRDDDNDNIYDDYDPNQYGSNDSDYNTDHSDTHEDYDWE